MTDSIQPSQEFIEDCLRYRGKILTGAKAHFCWDWDGLPVDETTPEFECCTCYPKGEPTHD